MLPPPPRVASSTYVLLLSCLSILSACDTTPVQPDVATDIAPGPYLRTAGGFVLSEARLQEVYDSLTRDVARALEDPGVRSTVYAQLHASPYPEHKLHFRTFLSGQGQALLDGIAAIRHVTPDAALGTLDSLVDFEFYMPVKEHWRTWAGGPDLLVVNDLSDDDEVLPALFDLQGNRVPGVSETEPPTTPTLSLVPAETDFSKPASASSGPGRAAMDAGPGLYMLTSYIEDLEEPWNKGAPEVEVHAFV